MAPARRRMRFAVRGFAAVLAAGIAVGTARAQVARPAADELLKTDIDLDAPELLPIERVVRFSLRGDDLAIASDFKLTDGRRQVRLEGLEGNTRVDVGQRPQRRMGLVPYFRLTHAGPANDEGAGIAETNVEVQGIRISLNRKATINEVETNVTFGQDELYRRNRGGWGFNGGLREMDRGGAGMFDPPRADRVRLSVRVTRPNEAADQINAEASSFAELLRQHPRTVARYLAPIFRQFQQDGTVFRIDDRIAWQLFPDAVEPDERIASKVNELVEQLNDDDFRQRELATAELEVLGGPAMLILGEMDRESLTAEQNSRIDAVLSRFSPLGDEEAATLLDDPEFLLRCFTYSDVPPVRAAAARALEKKLGEDLTLNATATLARRTRDADKIRERLPTD